MKYGFNCGIWGNIFVVPGIVADGFLKIADGSQLKVLLYLLRNNGKSFDNSLISQPVENEVIFGTNVEYAAGIETGSHRKKGAVHFIQKAATNYNSEYRKIIEEILKGNTEET